MQASLKTNLKKILTFAGQIPVISVLENQRQKEGTFKASLDHIASPCLKKLL